MEGVVRVGQNLRRNKNQIPLRNKRITGSENDRIRNFANPNYFAVKWILNFLQINSTISKNLRLHFRKLSLMLAKAGNTPE